MLSPAAGDRAEAPRGGCWSPRGDQQNADATPARSLRDDLLSLPSFSATQALAAADVSRTTQRFGLTRGVRLGAIGQRGAALTAGRTKVASPLGVHVRLEGSISRWLQDLRPLPV